MVRKPTPLLHPARRPSSVRFSMTARTC